MPRIDIPAKVTGAQTYIQNVRVPGMLHGRPVRPRGQASLFGMSPAGGPGEFHACERRREFDRALPGSPGGPEGQLRRRCGTEEYDAIQAAAQLKVEWSEGDTLPEQGTVRCQRSSPTRDAVVLNYGNVDKALAGPPRS